jgi:DNA-binding transcriptional LysR family regulator
MPPYLATWHEHDPAEKTPEELAQHNCLLFTLLKQFDTWSFDDGRNSVQVRGNVHSNNSEAIREMVLSGLGISLSPSWLYREDIDAGQVVQILPNYTPSSLPIYAALPANRRQSARVRAFVGFLAEAFAQDPDLTSNR